MVVRTGLPPDVLADLDPDLWNALSRGLELREVPGGVL
jgi:hypothetical protein